MFDGDETVRIRTTAARRPHSPDVHLPRAVLRQARGSSPPGFHGAGEFLFRVHAGRAVAQRPLERGRLLPERTNSSGSRARGRAEGYLTGADYSPDKQILTKPSNACADENMADSRTLQEIAPRRSAL